jgi:phage gp29-like protein
VFDLFDEMLDKDGHLYSVLQTRIYGVLSRERTVVPGGESARDTEVAEWVRATLEATPGWETALRGLLDCLAKGFSVVEIVWSYQPADSGGGAGSAGTRGRVVPLGLRHRLPQQFMIDARGRLRLLEGRDTLMWGRPDAVERGRVVPREKAMVMVFNPGPGNPHGVGLCQKAFWLHWFKKQTLKFWVIFNEKFGQPTVIGKYPSGSSAQDQEALLEVVESLQTDAGVTVPESMVIDLLEARRSGAVNTYKDLVDWCNDEMSKIVLGETLTADEGRRSGSLALGQVHNIVRNEYIERDAKALMAVVNEQLVQPLVRFNFGADVPPPRWVIDTTADEDLNRQLEVDRGLIAAGVPLSTDYFYRRYRRPVPGEGEKVLRYDDQNLFQYHLEFGVLTINEVRRSLGLGPVAWGDEPPRRRKMRDPEEERLTGIGAVSLTESPEDPEEEDKSPR